jgi:hypothetical protein
MKLFEVKTCRLTGGGKVPQKEIDELRKQGVHSATHYDHIASEYYVADNIQQVWTKVQEITCDFKGQATEVLGIGEVAPVLGDLTKDGVRGRNVLRSLDALNRESIHTLDTCALVYRLELLKDKSTNSQ